jgi:hypothetical protein
MISTERSIGSVAPRANVTHRSDTASRPNDNIASTQEAPNSPVALGNGATSNTPQQQDSTPFIQGPAPGAQDSISSLPEHIAAGKVAIQNCSQKKDLISPATATLLVNPASSAAEVSKNVPSGSRKHVGLSPGENQSKQSQGIVGWGWAFCRVRLSRGGMGGGRLRRGGLERGWGDLVLALLG